MNKIRLIAFDLDGTALLADHCSFSDRLVRDLDQAYHRGIEILPVTGRRYKMLPPALQTPQPWFHLLVCANGAEICDLQSGQQLFDDYIDHDTAQSLARLALEHDIIMELSGDTYTYLTQRDLYKEKVQPNLTFHYQTVILPNAWIVSDLASQVSSINVIKIVWMPRDDQIDLSRRILHDFPVYASETDPHFVEISAGSSNKGTGLQKACDMLKIDLSNVLYVGDGANDLPAMRIAGISAAMGNASDKVKQSCSLTGPDNIHDGLAQIIETSIPGL